jgi:hypothetical protein
MSIIAAGTTTTTALSSTGNTDGTLQFQVNGTTPSVTLNTLGAIGVGSTPNYGTSGQALVSGGSTAAPTWASVTTSPAGSNTQIQYNNAGAFGASSNLTWNGSALAVTGAINATGGISGTAGANISGAGWGVLPYVANSLVLDNNSGESRFFATGANSTTDGSFLFYTGQTDGGANERFRIGTAGQFGIGGANYGTSGQVLTSAGSGSAPTWSTPAGGAMVLLATYDAAGASTVNVENAFDSTYQTYLIMYNNCSPVNNNASLFSRFKINGSYLTSSDYRFLMTRPTSSSESFLASNATANTSITLTVSQSFNTNDTASGSYYVFRPFAGKNQSIYHQGTYFNGGDNQVNATTAGATNITGACTGVRFFYSSGNFATGTFYLYGIKAS